MSSSGFYVFTIQFSTKIVKRDNFGFDTFPAIAYTHCVCPAWASGIEDTELFKRVKVPYAQKLMSRSIGKSQAVGNLPYGHQKIPTELSG